MPRRDRLTRFVAALLRRLRPAAAADDVLGDLLEHYSRRRRWARTWLVVEAAKLAWGFHQPVVPGHRPAARGVLLDIWMRDVRYALRSLFRSRGFAAVALTSLALGIGLTTAVFSVIDGILLRPLPYGDTDAIVRIREVPAPGGPPSDYDLPPTLLRRWERTSQTLAAFGPYVVGEARLTAEGESFAGIKVEVGDRFFDVLLTIPEMGRLLGRADGDPAAPMVALLSHAFWRSAFAGRPDVVGRRILIDDEPAEVVGVLPDRFTYPSEETAIYVPERWHIPEPEVRYNTAYIVPPIRVLGRMRAGVSPADVEREAGAVALQILRPAPDPGSVAPAFLVVRLQDDLVRDIRPALMMLLAAVACVLAIVCVNLTSLLLARGTVRQREMAVRAALGASRWGMARPLALEGLLLALFGGGAGLLLASSMLASLPLTASIDPQLAAQVRIDGRVLLFTLGVSAFIGVVVGMLPAWQAPAGEVKAAVSSSHVHVLPGTAVRAERVRGALVVVQVALAIVLAVGAALLSRSLVTLLTVDLGFQPAQALSFQVRLPPGKGLAWDWRARFYEDFLTRLSAHSAVHAAGFSTSLPMHETFSQGVVRIDGVEAPGPDTPMRAHREVVTPGYFAALGMRVTEGRGLLPTDTAASERVVVVNEALVDAYLRGREPLGQRVMLFGQWHRLVGVVRSKRHTGLRSDGRPEYYAALAQAPPDIAGGPGAGIVVRAAGEPRALLPHVRSTLRDLQPQAAIENEVALDERVWASTAQPRFYATVMGVFATLALVTALVGLFGVLSCIVERRRVEIGVRRALGATGRDVSGLVLGRGLKLVGLAIPLGLLGAAAGVGLLRSLLFGIEPVDPATFAIVIVLVPVVALTACVMPARRAMQIEPLDALREE